MINVYVRKPGFQLISSYNFLYTDYMFLYIFCQWLTEDFLKLTNIGRHHLFLLCHKLHDASSVLGDLCFHLKMLIIQKPIMRV